MVNQLGLPPTTSTVAHVKSVLQQAIAQEEEVIQTASSRVSYYRQQLESLTTTLESVPDATPAVEPVPVLNETTTSTSNGTAATSKAVPLLSAQTPKRPPVRSAAKSKQPATKPKQPVAKRTAPATSTAPVAEPAALATVPEPTDLPKLLKRFRDKTIVEAIATVLSEQPENALDYKQVTEQVYGAAALKESVVQKKVSRIVSSHLIRGADKGHWTKTGLNPTLYQSLLPSELAAAKS